MVANTPIAFPLHCSHIVFMGSNGGLFRIRLLPVHGLAFSGSAKSGSSGFWSHVFAVDVAGLSGDRDEPDGFKSAGWWWPDFDSCGDGGGANPTKVDAKSPDGMNHGFREVHVGITDTPLLDLKWILTAEQRTRAIPRG